MEAAQLLARIIAQGAPVGAAAFSSQPVFKSLIKAGLIEEFGVVQSVFCDDCCTPHDAELTIENGQYGIHCPELGFVAKERSAVMAVRPNIVRLVADLARDLGCKRCKSTPILGETWRIGVIDGSVASVAVYFHPRLRDGHDLKTMQDALTRETRTQFGVVITTAGELSAPLFQTVLLEECLTFDAEVGQLTVDSDLPMIAGVPVKNTGGRPSPYAENLARIISMRKVSGKTLPGVNEEARAILEDYQTLYEGEQTPSESAIKRAMKRA